MTRDSLKYVAAIGMAVALAALGFLRFSPLAARADERSSDKSAGKETTAAAPSASSADEKLPIDPAASQIRPGDWNQWGGSPVRNNTPDGKNIPTDWNLGEFDDNTGAWNKENGEEHQMGRPARFAKSTATRSSPTARSTSAPTTAAAI